MCGLGGIVTSSEFQRNAFADYLHLELAIRGPDHSGRLDFRLDAARRELNLFHFRLSIQDPNPRSSQPMTDSTGRYSIIFNGEIYNFHELRVQFLNQEGLKTTSDTEILLELYALKGIAAFKLLDGMFALAIYDSMEKTLVLARDQFGVKPLYYSSLGGQLLFCSEIKPLLDVHIQSCSISPSSISSFLYEDRYDRGATTFFDSINTLLPGHAIFFDLSHEELDLGRLVHWSQGSLSERWNGSFEDSTSELRNRFIKAVKWQMRSDRPIAFALSGGIDSSAIVCVARLLYPDMPIHTFSYVGLGDSSSEEHWIDLVNDHVGAISHKVYASSGNRDSIENFVYRQGEPVNNSHFFAQYLVFQAASSAGFPVVLEGQGADEILGGYLGYPSAKLIGYLKNGRLIAAIRFLRSWASWHDSSAMAVILAATFKLTRPLLDLAVTSPALARFSGYGRASRRNKSSARAGKRLRPPLWLKDLGGRRDPLNVSLVESSFWDLLPRLLRHGDRNAMSHSVENRVPFLSQQFAFFALQLNPEHLVEEKGTTKFAFREAMRGIVPQEVLSRRDKVGFSAESNLLQPLSRSGLSGPVNSVKYREGLLEIWLSRVKIGDLEN